MIHALLDRGLVPEPIVRLAIRRLLAGRLASERRTQPPSPEARLARLRRELSEAPIALVPEAANEQHYELPPAFFRAVLGPRLKYSSAYWPAGVATLAQAEEAMLALTAERARIEDGQRILDLGCGWGSLALWLAERFPNARVVAVSNSRPQGNLIRSEAARRGLSNVVHQVADINHLALDGKFDRVVSVEMFEHLRNYERLFGHLNDWLAPGGELFVHVFCHREYAYPFEDRGPADWMARHFFTGGLMPSADLLPSFRGPLELAARWRVEGTHYARTAEAWLANLEARRDEVLQIFVSAYGWRNATRWYERWHVFFLACVELFAYRGGEEWMVAHYRFAKPPAAG
jgi:cyclopropane-fatty-acyl-phospholipid synthase